MTDYRFDELGWLQFEQLCTEVLALETGAARGDWRGSADTRRQLVSRQDLRVPGTERKLAAPVLVSAVWVGASGGPPPSPPPEDTASLLLLTNAPAYAVDGEQLGSDLGFDDVAVLGSAQLGRIVDAHPELRFRLPVMLSAPDLEGLFDPGARERSSLDVPDAQRLARVFVPTRAYLRALGVLREHGFAVLTGPPEMGKTASARMLCLAAMTCGWQAHECTRPEQVWESFDAERAQVFVADDAFGSTEYRPDAAERWARELDPILRATDDRHWLIWTSRPAPLKAALRRIHRERGAERFPAPAQVHVDASDLSEEEKVLILFRHAKAAGLDERRRKVVRRHGPEIVRHRHFTPERIRRFVTSRLEALVLSPYAAGAVAEQIEAEIQDPTDAMRESFRALSPEHRALLASLLDTPPGPVPERELAATTRRHAGRLGDRPAALVDRLSDHFLRVVPPSRVTWVHPSWRDLVIDELVADPDARREFIGACAFDGLMLALSTAGGVEGERELPLLAADADWDALNDRLAHALPEFDGGQVEQLLAALTEATFSRRVPVATRGELLASAALVLGILQRRWDRAHAPVPPGTLAAWYELAASLPEEDRPKPPLVEATWLELAPREPPDLDSTEDVNAFDDWLWLAEIVAEYEPQRLVDLGFPARYASVLAATIASADAEMPARWSAYHRQLVAQALRRVMHLCPAWATDAREIILTIPDFGAPPLPEEPEEGPEPEGWTAHASVVDRVLQDL